MTDQPEAARPPVDAAAPSTPSIAPAAPAAKRRPHWTTRAFYVLLMIVAGGGIYIATRYHIVFGSGLPSRPLIGGMVLVERAEWGVSDIYVNLDEAKRWDAATIAEHAQTVRELLASGWLKPEHLVTVRGQVLAEQVEDLSHDGFWCTGKSCSTTREDCEAIRARATGSTPQCTTRTAWCYSTATGKSCLQSQKACDAERRDQSRTDDPPTTGCVRSW